MALTWAQQGYDIEPDSVRAEEWINAFNYQYAPPADDWGFAITSDLVAHPLEERKHLVRIGFQAAEVADDRPLNVTLVLDASGSMRDGNRVDIARSAAEAIRRSLRPQDRVAVVHFTTDVIHHLTVDHRSPDDSSVESSIAQLSPGGSTNVQAGLNLGVQLANRARLERPEANNYVILMSDGVANVDATNPFAILESAYDRDAGNPLRLITVGVGINNYNDVLLEQLAQHGNGWYRYLNDPDQARVTFSRENWLALSTPFADQTRAQVTWDPDVVKSWRIIGYENRVTSDASFAEDRKEFAELPSGTATTVYYEVELQDGVRRGGDLTLGRVELRWVVPDTGQSRSQQVEVTGRPDGSFGSAAVDPLLRLGGIVALAADRYSSLPRGADDGAAGSVHRPGHLAGGAGDAGRSAGRAGRLSRLPLPAGAHGGAGLPTGPAGSPLRLQPLALRRLPVTATGRRRCQRGHTGLGRAPTRDGPTGRTRPAALRQRRIVRRLEEPVVDAGHDLPVGLGIGPELLPLGVVDEAAPLPLAVGHVGKARQIDQPVAAAHDLVPKPHHVHAVPLEEAQRMFAEARVYHRHAAGKNLVDAQFVQHGGGTSDGERAGA